MYPTVPQNSAKANEIIDMYVKYTITGKTPTNSNFDAKNQIEYKNRYSPADAQLKKDFHHQR